MSAVRRAYLYVVAFISLEAVVLGAIQLSRALLSPRAATGRQDLAIALAMLLVGLPVLALHGWLIQRSLQSDPEERATSARAAFLYAALLVNLLLAVQNTLALLNRLLLGITGASLSRAITGGQQSTLENLAAVLVAGLAAAGLYWWLRQDGKSGLPGPAFAEPRRLFRYTWLVYGLALSIYGAQNLLSFFFNLFLAPGNGTSFLLANGLAAVLVGGVISLTAWQVIRRSLSAPDEHTSALRLVLLYALTFLSLAAVLAAGGWVLYRLFQTLLGSATMSEFLLHIAGPLAAGLPAVVLLFYAGRALSRTLTDERFRNARQRPNEIPSKPKTAQKALSSRRAGLQRLFFYFLAGAGLATGFAGLLVLLPAILAALFGPGWNSPPLRDDLAAGLAALIVGLPLWLLSWRPMQLEALQEGEAGARARRSPLRKTYLFLGLFAGVLGSMLSGGLLLFLLINAGLGSRPSDFFLEGSQMTARLALFALLLAYHARLLQRDARLAERALARLHAQYPVLVLAPDPPGAAAQPIRDSSSGNGLQPGDIASEFAIEMVNALQRQAPSLPVAVHPYSQGVPDESLSAAQAVIVPGELIVKPSEAWRLWLQAFTGQRLVVPTESSAWHWVSDRSSLPALARRTARLVRSLAEGEDASERTGSPWQSAGYVLVALLLLAITLATLAISTGRILP